MFRHNRGSRTTTWQKAEKKNRLESLAEESDSLVLESKRQPSRILSNPEHEEFWANQRGPSRKAKYSRETDSEPVL